MAKILMEEEYAFSAAHRLPGFPEDHRDNGIHGHTWTIAFQVEVEVGDGPGYAFDHAVLDRVAAKVLSLVDHKVINDVPGLERGLNEDLVMVLGRAYARALWESIYVATLTKVVLTQLSSGRAFRLVRHVTLWSPTSADNHAAQTGAFHP